MIGRNVFFLIKFQEIPFGYLCWAGKGVIAVECLYPMLRMGTKVTISTECTYRNVVTL